MPLIREDVETVILRALRDALNRTGENSDRYAGVFVETESDGIAVLQPNGIHFLVQVSPAVIEVPGK